jgi:formate C-acetyltransferase
MDKVALAKSNIVMKTARNIQRGYAVDDASRGAYREDVRLGIERQRLITEAYKATEGEPMVRRRAKALEHILLNMTIYIQPWEMMVGNFSESPCHLPYAIEENWGSVHKLVHSEAGAALLDDAGRQEFEALCQYWQGRSISDVHQQYFDAEMKQDFRYEGTFLWSIWSEGGIPNFDKLLKLGLNGIIDQAIDKLRDIDRNGAKDYTEQKDFLEAVIISLNAAITFAHRYAEEARQLLKHEKNEQRRAEHHCRDLRLGSRPSCQDIAGGDAVVLFCSPDQPAD